MPALLLCRQALFSPCFKQFEKRSARPHNWQARCLASHGEATKNVGAPPVAEAKGLNNAQQIRMGSQNEKPKLKSLDQAEDELEAYCSMLSDDEEASTCWSAFDYLEHKRKEAEEGCASEVRDTGRPGASCSRLQALEQLSYELIGSGQVSSIVNTLATLSRTDTKSADQQVASGGEAVAFIDEGDLMVAHPRGQQEVESTHPDRRAYLRSLFSWLDHDHDGRLDMEEFRAAMRELGDELDGQTVALVGEALDAHGRLDEDQFLQAVEAEQEMATHNPVAQAWRVHQHKQEPHFRWGGPEC